MRVQISAVPTLKGKGKWFGRRICGRGRDLESFSDLSETSCYPKVTMLCLFRSGWTLLPRCFSRILLDLEPWWHWGALTNTTTIFTSKLITHLMRGPFTNSLNQVFCNYVAHKYLPKARKTVPFVALILVSSVKLVLKYIWQKPTVEYTDIRTSIRKHIQNQRRQPNFLKVSFVTGWTFTSKAKQNSTKIGIRLLQDHSTLIEGRKLYFLARPTLRR